MCFSCSFSLICCFDPTCFPLNFFELLSLLKVTFLTADHPWRPCVFFLSVEVAGFYLQWFIFISDICALGVTSPRTWQRHIYCGARKTCTCLAGFDVFACFSVFCVTHAHRALSTWMCVCVKCSGLSWQLTSSCGCFLPEKSDFSLVKLLIELGFQTQV